MSGAKEATVVFVAVPVSIVRTTLFVIGHQICTVYPVGLPDGANQCNVAEVAVILDVPKPKGIPGVGSGTWAGFTVILKNADANCTPCAFSDIISTL